jgi:hypothetical protein
MSYLLYGQPMEMWPDGMLRREFAGRIDRPAYLVMTDEEKRERHLPVTREELIERLKELGQ